MSIELIIFSYIADIIIFFSFLNICSKPRLNPVLTLALMALMRAALLFIIMPYINVIYIKIPYVIITGILMSGVFFHGQIREHIINVFIFWVSCSFSEAMVMILFSFINGGEAITQESGFSRIVLLTVNYIFIFAFSHFVALLKRRGNVLYSNHQIMLICVASFISGLELFLLGSLAIRYKEIQYTFIGGPLGVLSIIIIAVLARRVTIDAQREEERRFKTEQLELSRRQYMEMQSKYDTVRKLRHDMNNHLQTIIILQEDGNYDMIDKYLNELNDKLDSGDK